MGVLSDTARIAGLTCVRPLPSDGGDDGRTPEVRFRHQLSKGLERRRAHLFDLELKNFPAVTMPGYAARRVVYPRLAA